jgi:hypothetical protein
VLLKWTPGSGTFTKYVCPHFLAIPDNLDRSGLEMVYSDVHDQLLIMVPTISYGHITTDGALMVPFDCASATWGVPVPWFNMGQANTSSANYTDIASMRRLTDDGTYALLLFSANLSQLVGSHVWTITVPAAQITL